MIEELKKPGRKLKRSIIEEIDKNSKKYIPEFLEILRLESENPQDPNSRVEKNDYLYAMYFLARDRVVEAEQYILKLFSREGNYLNSLTGDLTFTDIPSILASVFSGDLTKYKEAVLNQNGNEYARAGILQAIAILTYNNKVEREKINHFYKDLYHELEKEPIFVYCILVQSSALIFNRLHEKEIRKSFQNHLIDEMYITINDIEEFWNNKEEAIISNEFNDYVFLDNPIYRMEEWADFSD